MYNGPGRLLIFIHFVSTYLHTAATGRWGVHQPQVLRLHAGADVNSTDQYTPETKVRSQTCKYEVCEVPLQFANAGAGAGMVRVVPSGEVQVTGFAPPQLLTYRYADHILVCMDSDE